MRMKKPTRAIIDQVRITRQGNDAIIDYADSGISGTRLGRVDWLSVDGVDDRPHRGVRPEHQGGGHKAVEREPFAGEQAHRRRAPEGRGGVEAPHIEALLKDHAGAEKADP